MQNRYIHIFIIVLLMVLTGCAVTKDERKVTGEDFIMEQMLDEERKWASPDEADQIDEEIESLHYNEKKEFNPVGFIFQNLFNSKSDEKDPEWLKREKSEKSTEQWQREFNDILDKYNAAE